MDMGFNFTASYTSSLCQQAGGLLRILSQGVCIDTVWVASEKVIKKIAVACPDFTQVLQLFWAELHYQGGLLINQTGLQVMHTYFSWVLMPFVVAALKKQIVFLIANRARGDIGMCPKAQRAYNLGVQSTLSWRAWLKSFVDPAAWTSSFYLGVSDGKKQGHKRKYDFSLVALVV